VKPLALFLPVFVICIFFVFVLPHFVRFPYVRNVNTPVGVTALGYGVHTEALPAAENLTDEYFAVRDYTDLEGFTASLYNGQANQIVGVFARGLFALPVRQQPAGEPDFVDRENNILTEFSLPRKYGSTGLLAHNFLSGSRFFQLKKNQDVVLIYGDGRQEHYRITQAVSFQALKPTSPFSDFVDISNPGSGTLSSADLFNRVYTTRNQLVFQTCIEANGEPSWGRMFFIASPVEPIQLNVPALDTVSNPN